MVAARYLKKTTYITYVILYRRDHNLRNSDDDQNFWQAPEGWAKYSSDPSKRETDAVLLDRIP